MCFGSVVGEINLPGAKPSHGSESGHNPSVLPGHPGELASMLDPAE
jgi:hypothetical protein